MRELLAWVEYLEDACQQSKVRYPLKDTLLNVVLNA